MDGRRVVVVACVCAITAERVSCQGGDEFSNTSHRTARAECTPDIRVPSSRDRVPPGAGDATRVFGHARPSSEQIDLYAFTTANALIQLYHCQSHKACSHKEISLGALRCRLRIKKKQWFH